MPGSASPTCEGPRPPHPSHARGGARDGAGSAEPVTSSDDLGTAFTGPPPRRVVSLVPSLTEAIAATDAGLLAGATDWCTHPAGLDVARVGGTKWPDLDRVRALAPDLVIANAEENRAEDVAALRDVGIPVWVTAPATVDQALTSLDRLCAVLDRPQPEWLRRVHRVWADVPRLPAVTA